MKILQRIKNKINYIEKTVKAIKLQNEVIQKQNKQIIQHNKWVEEVLAIAAISNSEIYKAVDIHARLLKKKSLNMQKHIAYRTWTLTDREYEDLLIELNKKNEINQDKEDTILKIICDKTGKEKKEAKKLRSAIVNKGFTDKDIFYSELYKMSIEEVDELIPRNKRAVPYWAKESINLLTDDERYILSNEWQVHEGRFFLEELKCKNNCGSIRKEFSRYKLFDVPYDKMKDYLFYSDRQYMLYKHCNFPYANKYVSNKANFNMLLKEIIHRRWFLTRDLSYSVFVKKIEGLEEIIVKPVSGTLQGDGVEKLAVNENESENLKTYEHIISRGDNIIVEECLKNHPDIGRIYPNTLNTIRIITMVKDNNVEVLCSAIKFGSGDVVDNLHKGGIVAGVDVKYGKICTHAVNSKGVIYKTHPISGEMILGRKIPCWNKIIDTCKKAALLLEAVPFIGWDVAVTEKNMVEIIEGNHNPDFSLVQMPYAFSNGEGIKYMFNDYLDN